MAIATLLLKASRKELHSVIRFLWAKGLCANAIHPEMRPVYGDKCFTRPAIHVWCKKFAHGRESVVDDERLGHRVVSMTDVLLSSSHLYGLLLILLLSKCRM